MEFNSDKIDELTANPCVAKAKVDYFHSETTSVLKKICGCSCKYHFINPAVNFVLSYLHIILTFCVSCSTSDALFGRVIIIFLLEQPCNVNQILIISRHMAAMIQDG